jgi:hypothetical protein
MFGWLFHPTCPCDQAAKLWVEERLQWLAEEFADSAFNGRRLVLPTPDCFPDPYDRSPKSIRTLLERVCGYMDVDPDLVSMNLVADSSNLWFVNAAGNYLPKAAGTYQEVRDEWESQFSNQTELSQDEWESQFGNQTELLQAAGTSRKGGGRFLISIDQSGLDDPMGLVGTIAHELAHVRLLGEGRVPGDIYDNELLTDLTVVHFGLGIFLANTPRNWDSQYGKWPNSDLNKPEYMTPPMFGYALAHLAWFRGETKPTWARYLHWNSRGDFRQGLRFLHALEESAYKPRRLRTPIQRNGGE